MCELHQSLLAVVKYSQWLFKHFSKMIMYVLRNLILMFKNLMFMTYSICYPITSLFPKRTTIFISTRWTTHLSICRNANLHSIFSNIFWGFSQSRFLLSKHCASHIYYIRVLLIARKPMTYWGLGAWLVGQFMDKIITKYWFFLRHCARC